MGKWCGPPREEQYLCGAHSRHSGQPCKQFAMTNGRCYLHGGKSTGAKIPHRNIKHGLRTKEAMEEKRQLTELLKLARKTVESVT